MTDDRAAYNGPDTTEVITRLIVLVPNGSLLFLGRDQMDVPFDMRGKLHDFGDDDDDNPDHEEAGEIKLDTSRRLRTRERESKTTQSDRPNGQLSPRYVICTIKHR
jgi:hypothetical protein